MTAPIAPMPAEAAPLATASNALGVDLWHRAATPGANVAMSPASISAALAMTWGGAKGETEHQMRAVLHLDAQPSLGASDCAKMLRGLESPSRKIQLRIANRLFGEKTFPFEKSFVDRTKTDWNAPLETVDFLHAPDAAREKINAWVAHETNDKIRELVPAGAVNGATRLALVDAIYFLAAWKSPFEKDVTESGAFHVAADRTKNVPTMHQTHWFRLAQRDGASVLELPYAGDDASMWIVLPDKTDGLADVEKRLSAAQLATWKSALETKEIDLALPKFEIRPSAPLSLAGPLGALGMTDAFDPDKADFSAIGVPPDPKMRLFVSSVLHEAFVKVDEKGTEASAATAVLMAVGAGMPPQITRFYVDHPFLFFVVDDASGLVLFMGRVTDP